MKLKNVVTALSDIPEAFHELYAVLEDGDDKGKYALTGVETGYKQTKALQTEAGKYRIERNTYQQKFEDANLKLAAFGDLNADEVKTKLDRITELEESAKGKVPEAKLNELAEQRAAAKIAPLQRELATAKTELEKSTKIIGEYKTASDTSKILDQTRGLASTLGFEDAAFATPGGAGSLMVLQLFKVDEAGNVVAKDGSGFTPGLPPSEVLPELLEKHSYLGKRSSGLGANGSDPSGNGKGSGKNVFMSDDLTARYALQKTNPTEFDRQFRASGLANDFDPAPKKA